MITFSLAVGRRWMRQLAAETAPAARRVFLLRLLGDAVLFTLAALAAALLPILVPRPGFTAMRLLCQAFFGEAVLLAAFVAAVVFRAGQRARALLPSLAAL